MRKLLWKEGYRGKKMKKKKGSDGVIVGLQTLPFISNIPSPLHLPGNLALALVPSLDSSFVCCFTAW